MLQWYSLKVCREANALTLKMSMRLLINHLKIFTLILEASKWYMTRQKNPRWFWIFSRSLWIAGVLHEITSTVTKDAEENQIFMRTNDRLENYGGNLHRTRTLPISGLRHSTESLF